MLSIEAVIRECDANRWRFLHLAHRRNDDAYTCILQSVARWDEGALTWAQGEGDTPTVAVNAAYDLMCERCDIKVPHMRAARGVPPDDRKRALTDDERMHDLLRLDVDLRLSLFEACQRWLNAHGRAAT